MSISSCGISSRASSQIARLGLTFVESVNIWRFLRPFKSGDVQLMLQLQSSRQESLGVVPPKTLSGTNTRDGNALCRYFSLDSERYSRVGAGEASPSSILRRFTGSALTPR